MKIDIQIKSAKDFPISLKMKWENKLLTNELLQKAIEYLQIIKEEWESL